MGNRASDTATSATGLDCQSEEGRARAAQIKKDAEELMKLATDTVSEIDQGDQRDIQEICEREEPSRLSEAVFKHIDRWKATPLNVAVVGLTGSGKSTYINTARGLKNAECEGAAPVGTSECTMKPEPYPHPDNPMVVYWDLPGVGTPTFPKEVYMDKIDLSLFDFFLIISSKRFRDEDAWFGQEIRQKLKKKFYFVRTHVDADVESELSDYPDKYEKLFQATNVFSEDPAEQAMRFKEHATGIITKDIRKKTTESLLKQGNVELPKIFLLDSKHPGNALYDFMALQDSILNNLEGLKRDVFFLSLSAQCKEDVEKKVKYLRSYGWKVALASGAGGLIPVPGVSLALDTTLIISTSIFFHRQLGLHKKTESNAARELMQDSSFINAQWVMSVAKTLPLAFAIQFAEEGLKAIPIAGVIVGAVFGAPASFIATRQILRAILDKMEKVALARIRGSLETYKELHRQASSLSTDTSEPMTSRLNCTEEN